MISVDGSHGHRLAHKAGFLCKLAMPLLAAALGLNCGDVYRPVAIPIPGQSPTPAAVGHMVVVSTNGTDPANPMLGAGAASRIDVSGDSVISSSSTGLVPGRAIVSSSGRLYVPNTGEDTVFASPVASAPQGTTIDLLPLCSGNVCPSVSPVFAETTETSRLYVAGVGNGTISVIDTNFNALVQTFAVDPAHAGSPLPQPDTASHPVALAELPNGTKIYSVNQGANSVSSINSSDGHINKVIPVGLSPVWAAANADSLHVYVLDSAGSIWIIDTTTETATQVPYGAVGALPNHLFYDKVFNRVFATDANANPPRLAMFDVTGTTGNPNGSLTPHGLGFAVLTTAPGSACTGTLVPTSVTVLGDGSRAYVASYQTGAGLVCTQASVIDAESGLLSKTISLSTAADNAAETNCDFPHNPASGSPAFGFRTFVSSSLGGANSLFKVYVSQCDAGTTAIVDTTAVSTGPNPHPADWLAGWLASPVSSFDGSQAKISAATQTPATASSTALTTYSYNLLSGPAPTMGMTIYISGMTDAFDNGAFVISGISNGTFTVTNPGCGTAGSKTPPCADISSQSGSGTILPPKNPTFLVPAP